MNFLFEPEGMKALAMLFFAILAVLGMGGLAILSISALFINNEMTNVDTLNIHGHENNITEDEVELIEHNKIA